MRTEDKELLLRDLCARLPYGVKVLTLFENKEVNGLLEAVYPEDDRIIISNLSRPCHYLKQDCGGFIIEENGCKPYLFPLSSMTKEQSMEFALLQVNTHKDGFLYVCDCANMMKWLLKNHFDIYGLIEKGLAIDATNLNIY